LTAGRPQTALRRHIGGCGHCRDRLQRLESFYRILKQELSDGPDPVAIDFSKRSAPKTTTYGLLICSPLPDRNDRRGEAYLAALAFSANGQGSTTRLADYPVPSDHIGVIVYTDVANEKQILIARLNGKGLAHWRLSIPGIAALLTLNPAGSVCMPLLGIEILHNRLFFFKKTAKRIAAGSPLHQICSSLSI